MNTAIRSVVALVATVITVSQAPPMAADPVRDLQWHVRYMDLDRAQTFSRGAGVIIGIVDTGVDKDHPDLAGSVLPGKDYIDDGGDGRTDLDGHGTGTAGLIVAHGRALGVAPLAKVLPIRNVADSSAPGRGSEVVQWAVDHGATVLCLAYGEASSSAGRQAIAEAIRRDVVVVAAIGNEPRIPNQEYPAAYPGVVGAAGVDRNGEHAAISVRSPYATLAAPAVDITSTDIRTPGHNGYRTGTGTSDATAIIAGAAALVRAKFPQLSAAEVIHRLEATADDKGPPGRDDLYGYGVINIVKALTADVPPMTPSANPSVEATLPRDDLDAGMALKLTTVVLVTLMIVLLILTAYVRYLRRHRSR